MFFATFDYFGTFSTSDHFTKLAGGYLSQIQVFSRLKAYLRRILLSPNYIPPFLCVACPISYNDISKVYLSQRFEVRVIVFHNCTWVDEVHVLLRCNVTSILSLSSFLFFFLFCLYIFFFY